MQKHRFRAGDRVVVSDPANGNVRPGVYTIIRALPVSSNGCEYRAKSALDTFERIVEEASLRPAKDG
ncbi:MAG TPA: hypothetical protein VFA03_04480 [Acetobacteraceae bacterium]|nr:hypothetical protein [Acetobacteraceae bacterium]